MTRKIIHIDMDAFYTSVEQRDRPSLKGRPVVVGGDPYGRGVVAGASYEARKFGVRSAMSSAKALRLCPKLIFITPDISRYRKVSEQIQKIFLEVTSLVEPLSLDEAYLDVTENALGEPLASQVAIYLKEKIKSTTGLTASAGVGPNKFIAKVASDLRKPDGLVVVPPQKVHEFVEMLPVEKLWGVGPVTAENLHAMGLFTAKDIRKCAVAELENSLGRFGSFLFKLAHGEDDRPVEPESEPKSCGTETTFEKDETSLDSLHDFLQEQAEEIALELRKIERPGRTITLKLRYSDFKTITRSRTLLRATGDAKLIAQTAIELLSHTEAGQRPVRLIGISVGGFLNPDWPEQLWFDWESPLLTPKIFS